MTHSIWKLGLICQNARFNEIFRDLMLKVHNLIWMCWIIYIYSTTDAWYLQHEELPSGSVASKLTNILEITGMYRHSVRDLFGTERSLRDAAGNIRSPNVYKFIRNQDHLSAVWRKDRACSNFNYNVSLPTLRLKPCWGMAWFKNVSSGKLWEETWIWQVRDFAKGKVLCILSLVDLGSRFISLLVAGHIPGVSKRLKPQGNDILMIFNDVSYCRETIFLLWTLLAMFSGYEKDNKVSKRKAGAVKVTESGPRKIWNVSFFNKVWTGTTDSFFEGNEFERP